MRATSDGAVAGAIEMSALLYSRWGIDWWCRWREAQGREGDLGMRVGRKLARGLLER